MSVSEWREVRIGDIGDVVTGKTPSSKNPEYFGDEIPFVTPTDYKNYHKNIYSSERYLSQAGKEVLGNKLLPINSVIVTCIGSDMGKVAINKVECITNQQINSIILKRDLADSDFIYYTLISMQEYLKMLARGGTTMPIVNKSTFEEIKLLLPPFPEQKAIAATLSALDDMIELNNQINKTLEEMAQAIFKSWFVDFEPFRDGEFEESELGLIPKGWRVGKLDDVLSEIETGNRPKGGVAGVESGIPSIGAENVLGLGKYDYSKEKYVSEEFYNSMKKGKLKDWDVLLYKDGAQLGRKTMFALGFPHKKCCVNSHVFILRSNSRMNQCYLYFWLDQDYMTQKIIGLNANSAQPGINQPAVKGLPILIPPIDVLERFDDLVVPIIKNLFSNCLENNILVSIRDTLLPKLMSGEIRVPVDEVM